MAWLRAKDIEQAKDDDPAVEQVQGNVIRTIAELEVAQLHRGELVTPPTAVAKSSEVNEDDPEISAVA
jgi:hypothetical protein